MPRVSPFQIHSVDACCAVLHRWTWSTISAALSQSQIQLTFVSWHAQALIFCCLVVQLVFGSSNIISTNASLSLSFVTLKAKSLAI